MSGEDLKQYIKDSGLTMSQIARELGVTPQNIQARLGRKIVKADFVVKIQEAVSKCARPLPSEMGAAVIGSNINGSHSPNVSQSIGCDSAIATEVKLLREQNEFLQSQVKTLLSILEKERQR